MTALCKDIYEIRREICLSQTITEVDESLFNFYNKLTTGLLLCYLNDIEEKIPQYGLRFLAYTCIYEVLYLRYPHISKKIDPLLFENWCLLNDIEKLYKILEG